MDPFILTLTQDGLDDVLAPWSASQGDTLMESDEDEALLAVARRADQQGGNPLFSVRREGIREPRSWQNGRNKIVNPMKICWAKRSPRRSIRVCATMCANGGLPLKIFRCVWLFIIVRERTYIPAVR